MLENNEVFELLLAAIPLVEHCRMLTRKQIPLNLIQKKALDDLAQLLFNQGYYEQKMFYLAGWSHPDILFLEEYISLHITR